MGNPRACTICGCTEERACDGGCSWVGADGLYCSQCVCWAALVTPNPYEGILPYDLLPVRTFEARAASTPCGFAWPIDQRRITPQVLERMAYVFAPTVGLLPEEFLAEVADLNDAYAVAIPANRVLMVVVAQTVEIAAAMVEEYKATHKVTGGRRVVYWHEPTAMGTLALQPEGGR